MEIPFTPTEVTELQAFIADFNRLGDTRLSIEQYLAELIRHQTLRPWRIRLLERNAERRKSVIASLPPEADAELQALVDKYSGKVTVVSDTKGTKG